MAGEKEYKRLSGARYWFRIAGLYQAKDHLLMVQSVGFAEEYKRFYFQDIQAILLRPSQRLLLWSLVWGILSLASGWLVYASNGWTYTPGSGPLWLFSVFFLICLAANLSLGPSCICHIKTAIQTVEVPLTRFRQAEKIIARLRPLIEQNQQNPGQEPSSGAPAAPLAGPVDGIPGVPPVSPILQPFRTWVHWVFFFIVLLASAFEAIRFVQHFVLHFRNEISFLTGSITLGSAALGRQRGKDAPAMLRKVTWGAFIFLAIYVGLFVISNLLIHRQGMGEAMKSLAVQPPDATPWQLFMSGTLIIGGLLFGLLGIVELALYQKRKRQISPMA